MALPDALVAPFFRERSVLFAPHEVLCALAFAMVWLLALGCSSNAPTTEGPRDATQDSALDAGLSNDAAIHGDASSTWDCAVNCGDGTLRPADALDEGPGNPAVDAGVGDRGVSDTSGADARLDASDAVEGGSVPSTCPTGSTLNPLDPSNDWLAASQAGTHGVTGVRRSPSGDAILLAINMENRHPDRSQGEAGIDLAYTTGVRTAASFEHRTVSATFDVPPALVSTDPNCRNGLELFVKDNVPLGDAGGFDTAVHAQYGRWHNINQAGPMVVVLRPSAQHVDAEHSYTEPGFDPRVIRTIGIKIGAGTGNGSTGARCASTFTAELGVNGFEITPPIDLDAPPALPQQSTRPVLAGTTIDARPEGFFTNGQRVFFLGGNWRAIEYGQNFFHTAWFPGGNGLMQHAGFVGCELEQFGRAGVQVVRLGVIDDGRALLGDTGEVPSGDIEVFLDEVGHALDGAEARGIVVQLVLLDYLVAGRGARVGGVLLRGRPMLLTDASIRQAFVQQFVARLLQRFGRHPGLYGIDVINEPEWIIARSEGGLWEDVRGDDPSKAENPIPLAALRAFVEEVAVAKKQYASEKLLTVGTSIVTANLASQLAIDYLGLHYYPWMGRLDDLSAKVSKITPWALEEFSTWAGAAAIAPSLNGAAASGASGALLWNLTPSIDNETYTLAARNAVIEALAAWKP